MTKTFNINNAADLAAIAAAGFTYVTYVHYTSAAHETKGDVISRHRSYEAALKASKDDTFAGIHQVG